MKLRILVKLSKPEKMLRSTQVSRSMLKDLEISMHSIWTLFPLSSVCYFYNLKIPKFFFNAVVGVLPYIKKANDDDKMIWW